MTTTTFFQNHTGERSCVYIDTTGKRVIDRGFKRAQSFVGDHALVECSWGTSHWYRINRSGLIDARLVNEYSRDRVIECQPGICLSYRNGLWGLSSSSGKVLVKPKFEAMSIMREGVAAARENNKKFGYIDASGKWVIPPSFADASEFFSGRARVELPKKPKEPLPGSEIPQLAAAYAGAPAPRYGFINQTGKIVVPCKLADAYSFSGGLAAARNTQGAWGYIDATGRWAINPDLAAASSFHGGLSIVDRKKPAENGFSVWSEYMQITGAPCQKVPLWRVTDEHLNRVCAAGKEGFATDDGKLVVPLKFDRVRQFSEGFAAVKEKDGWGFINMNGEIIVPTRYKKVKDYHNGMAAVNESGLFGQHWGYVNEQGQVAIHPQFDRAEDFGEEVAFVEKRRTAAPSLRYLIDKSGRTIKEFPEDVRIFGPFANGLAAAQGGPRARQDFEGQRMVTLEFIEPRN